jgi:hypothetical protein
MDLVRSSTNFNRFDYQFLNQKYRFGHQEKLKFR